MGQFRLLKEKVSEKVESFSKSLLKLSKNWTDFTEKITTWGQSMGQKFSDFSEKLEALTIKFQPEKLIVAEVQEGLKTKQLIQGEMTFTDVSALSQTLWENHDIAQKAFQETNDLQYYEMAMDILVVIRELERLKDYLITHGKK